MRKRSPRAQSRRGQALVELALILPLLVVLLLMAIDFGRVFFGYIAIQNLSRIAANYAATHSDETDWGPASRYQELVMRDAHAINCDPVDISVPVYDPEPIEFGGDARVTIRCGFEPITPLVGAIVGSPLALSASSTFPVRGGCEDCGSLTGGIPDPPEQPPSCNTPPDMTDMSVGGARLSWSAAGFTGAFYPASDEGDDARTVTSQDYGGGAVPDAEGCLPHTTTVTVFYADVDPALCPDGAFVPNLVGMAVADARSAWVGAGFLVEEFLPSDPAPPDTDLVSEQVLAPTDVPPDGCAAADSSVTITTEEPPPTVGQYCHVPAFIDTWSTEAQDTWTTAGFSTVITFLQENRLPYIIAYQSVVNQYEFCDASITLGPKAGNP